VGRPPRRQHRDPAPAPAIRQQVCEDYGCPQNTKAAGRLTVGEVAIVLRNASTDQRERSKEQWQPMRPTSNWSETPITLLIQYLDEGDGRGTTLPRAIGEDRDRFMRTDQGWRFVSRSFEQLFVRHDP
jgi:hypothetical protein